MSSGENLVVTRLNDILSLLSGSDQMIDAHSVEEIHRLLREIGRQLADRLGKERSVGQANIHLNSEIEEHIFLNRPIKNIIKEVSTPYTYRDNFLNLKLWLIDAIVITIVDPYIYKYNSSSKIHLTEEDYIKDFLELIPENIERINIFHGEHVSQEVRKSLQEYTSKNNINLYEYKTTDIHDRVWIKENRAGKLVGSSLNGLGNKIAFVLDIPSDDLRIFIQELVRIVEAQNNRR